MISLLPAILTHARCLLPATGARPREGGPSRVRIFFNSSVSDKHSSVPDKTLSVMNKINSGLLNTLFVLNKVLIPVNDIVFAADKCFDDRPEVAAANMVFLFVAFLYGKPLTKAGGFDLSFVNDFAA
jgi:hypothetical protein